MSLVYRFPRSFSPAFRNIMRRVNRTAKKSGFWEDLSKMSKGCLVDEAERARICQHIALVHSELSEMLEAIRHGNPPSDHIPEFSGAEEEAADVVIRLMNICAQQGWRLAEAIEAKAQYNETRPHKHGGKRF